MRRTPIAVINNNKIYHVKTRKQELHEHFMNHAHAAGKIGAAVGAITTYALSRDAGHNRFTSIAHSAKSGLSGYGYGALAGAGYAALTKPKRKK